jgi:hypothetical protein
MNTPALVACGKENACVAWARRLFGADGTCGFLAARALPHLPFCWFWRHLRYACLTILLILPSFFYLLPHFILFSVCCSLLSCAYAVKKRGVAVCYILLLFYISGYSTALCWVRSGIETA